MKKNDVRIPQQKRSIEKKEKIVEAAFRIFMKKGYINSNTAEIASEAGISTGSLYAYFTDKKSILLECLDRFGNSVIKKICTNINSLSVTDDIYSTFQNVLKIFLDFYNLTEKLHNEVMSLRYIDEDVNNYFTHIQKMIIAAVIQQLEECGYTFRNEHEQSFLLYQMVLGIEDELAFKHSPNINKDVLINECAHAIVSMVVKKSISI